MDITTVGAWIVGMDVLRLGHACSDRVVGVDDMTVGGMDAPVSVALILHDFARLGFVLFVA